MAQSPETVGNKFAKSVKREDPVLDHIDALTERVDHIEDSALEAASQRWETVGTTAVKLGIGLASLSDAFLHNLRFFEIDKPSVLGIIIGSGLIVWGLQDAGEIPERFRRARELLRDSRMLRASLTRTMDEAIEMIPFRRLEQ